MANSSNDGEYRDYICGLVTDRERLQLQHDCVKDEFARVINRVLDEYSLEERLQQARDRLHSEPTSQPSRKHPQEPNWKTHILDVGCGEGIFLHDVAAILEERQLLEGAVLHGLDVSQEAIATAQEYSQLSKPPRPYLNFYTHDARQPLEDYLGIRMTMQPPFQFDFIYATMVLAYLPHAQNLIEQYYQRLKPGGILYLKELPTNVGQDVHPVLNDFTAATMRYISSINGGLNVAREEAGWLEKLGAEKIVSFDEAIPVGGKTPQGRMMLRNRVMIMRNSGPQLVRAGLVTQQQFDNAMEVLFRELGPHLQAQMVFVNTLARKPAAN